LKQQMPMLMESLYVWFVLLCLASSSIILTSSPQEPCAESHKAADNSRDATTWEKCDDSGLFASACRHNVPLVYTNIYKTGEKCVYVAFMTGSPLATPLASVIIYCYICFL
jgi:hypothetical protein